MVRKSTGLRLVLVVAAVVCAGSSAFAEPAGEAIGYVKTVAGEASVIRDGKRAHADAGLPLYEKDILETGTDGALGATLKDNTLLSLGPNSNLALESYLLAPKSDSYSLVARITQGTVQYVSGLIAKLSPESVQIRTPAATLGVRGTRLLIKVDPGGN